VDVTRSNWECTLEEVSGQKSEVGDQNNPALRLGLLCVKGLREEAGRAIARARSENPFSSLDDLHLRVPELRRDELRKLAAVGALNFIQGTSPNSKFQIPKSKAEPQAKQTLDP